MCSARMINTYELRVFRTPHSQSENDAIVISGASPPYLSLSSFVFGLCQLEYRLVFYNMRILCKECQYNPVIMIATA